MAPLAVGERIHIRGHTTDVEQAVESMQVDHAAVTSAAPGDDVALKVDGHVRDHDPSSARAERRRKANDRRESDPTPVVVWRRARSSSR